MSGDVQPRKRKDKRRKKEDEIIGGIHDLGESKDEIKEKPIVNTHASSDKGENIHVHHDHGIGGGLFVKIVFFALFAVLLGLVGIIFIESRGSTDVDLPSIEDSRFAEYFTGWLDDSPDEHGHDDHAVGSEEADNDHDDDGHENAHSEEADDGGHSEQDESEPAATEEEENDEEPEEKAASEQAVTEEESEEKVEPDDDDDDDTEEEEEEEESEVTAEEELDDDDDDVSDKNESDISNEVEDEDEENSEQLEDEDDENSVEETEEEDEDYDLTQENDSVENTPAPPSRKYSKPADKKIDVDQDSGVDDDEEESEEDDSLEGEPQAESFLDESAEEVEEIEESEEALKQEEEAVKKEQLSLLEDDEDVENISDLKLRRKKEKDLMRKLEKLLKEQEKAEGESDGEKEEEEEEGREENEETSGVALKLGVGVALVVVAHLVIVRRWRQLTHANEEPRELVASDEKEEPVSKDEEPVVSRRQTLIPETANIPNIPLDHAEDQLEDLLDDDEPDEQPIQRRTSVDIKKERQDPEKYYTKEELGDSEDLDEEEEYAEEEEYLEEELEEEVEEEEEEDYELEPSPSFSDQGDPDEEEELDEEEDEDEEDQEELQLPVPPPRSGPQGLEAEDVLENNYEPLLKEQPQELDDTDSLEANKGSAGPKAADEDDDDWFFRQELDFAEAHFQNKPQLALATYEKILEKSPGLLRALVGRARSLDQLADHQRSNEILGKAIEAYFTLVTDDASRLDDNTFLVIAERCVNRMRFAGRNVNAGVIQQALINRFPDDIKHRNNMAVSYLLGGRTKLAQTILEETLDRWPDDGFALVHLGFVLKTSLGQLEQGANLMEKGIQSNQPGTMDGRFLFHLGDALHRIGRGEEAMQWYELGVKNNLFKSKYQRSLYNVDRLTAKPWWSLESTTYLEFFKGLEKNWVKIREEGLALLQARDKALFQDEAENLKNTGDWKQMDLFLRGRKQTGCSRAPFTCQLISNFPPASTCSRGQAKFSVMEPGTHVWPHCGPTNCRLRAHLGLVVPEGVYLRVAEKTRSWKNGKVFVFDDSFEHEVWHNGSSVRLVLIVDVWHPEITSTERQTLSPI